jgi:hypothetical protein
MNKLVLFVLPLALVVGVVGSTYATAVDQSLSKSSEAVMDGNQKTGSFANGSKGVGVSGGSSHAWCCLLPDGENNPSAAKDNK